MQIRWVSGDILTLLIKIFWSCDDLQPAGRGLIDDVFIWMISSEVWMDFVRQTDFNKSISLCLCWERGFKFRSVDNCCVDTIPGACWAVTVYFARCRLIPGLTTQTDQMLHVYKKPFSSFWTFSICLYINIDVTKLKCLAADDSVSLTGPIHSHKLLRRYPGSPEDEAGERDQSFKTFPSASDLLAAMVTS